VLPPLPQCRNIFYANAEFFLFIKEHGPKTWKHRIYGTCLNGKTDLNFYLGTSLLFHLNQCWLLGIRDILVRTRMRIRILGSVPLTKGSGCGSGRPENIYIILQR
jgi:hypothetical protein